MRLDLVVADLERLQATGSVLQTKLGQPAVILNTDAAGVGWITKLWTRRASPSSDWLYPYHVRFMRHSAELGRRGIVAPDVDRWGMVAGTRRRYVRYRHIRGESLRSLAARTGGIDVSGLAAFVAALHVKGIYFRSLHLGNILQTDADGYAVIDVADVTFREKALRAGMRARNLSFLFSYPEDAARLDAQRFFDAYRRAGSLDGAQMNALERAFVSALARRSG